MWCPHGKTEETGCDHGCELFVNHGMWPPTVFKVFLPLDTTNPDTFALALSNRGRKKHRVPVADVFDHFKPEEHHVFLLCNLHLNYEGQHYLEVIQIVTEEEYKHGT